MSYRLYIYGMISLLELKIHIVIVVRHRVKGQGHRGQNVQFVSVHYLSNCLSQRLHIYHGIVFRGQRVKGKGHRDE